MKIGVMVDQICKGGATKLAIEEVRQLYKEGHDTELLVLYDNGQGLYQDILKEVKIRILWYEVPRILRLNVKIPFFSFFSLFHITYIIILPFLIGKKEYDYVVSHLTYTCFSAYSLSKVRKIPYIAYIHDSISYILKKVYLKKIGLSVFFYPIFLFAGVVDRLILRGAFAVCKQSNFESEYLRKIGKKRIYIAPPATYRRRGTIPGRRGDRLSAFTKWDLSKNFGFLIEIVKHMPISQKLYVAGQWHPKEYLVKVKGLIAKENLSNRIVFLSDLNESEIQSFFDNALVLIHPLIEAWGSTLYEAACNGVTFIAPKGCGIADFLIGGKDAFYPEQGNLEQYTTYLMKFLNTPSLAYEMGRQAWLDIKDIDIKYHVQVLLEAMRGERS